MKYDKAKWPNPLLAHLLLLASSVGAAASPVRSDDWAGFAAKIMCSGVFVSGRVPSDIRTQDLNGLLTNVELNVDYNSAVVTANSYTAIYFGQSEGCRLYADKQAAVQALRQRKSSLTHPTMLFSQEWPMGDAVNIPSLHENAKLSRTFDQAFSPEKGTRAIVVVRHGRIVAERYDTNGHFYPNTPMLGWSLTKSLMNAQAGVLVKNGMLDIDAPLTLPEWKEATDKRSQITTRHLLQMSSGLKYEERYAPGTDAALTLFWAPDSARFVTDLSRPLLHDPGTHFNYSSGDASILSRVIRRRLENSAIEYSTFAEESLFRPLGMRSAVLEKDSQGTYVGAAFAYATARDWARFGLLYLNQGRFMGQELLSPDWVAFTHHKSPSAQDGEYGALFWLPSFSFLNQFPSIPNTMFFGEGYLGQTISVIPSDDLVIVRMGWSPPTVWTQQDVVLMITGVIDAFRGQK